MYVRADVISDAGMIHSLQVSPRRRERSRLFLALSLCAQADCQPQIATPSRFAAAPRPLPVRALSSSQYQNHNRSHHTAAHRLDVVHPRAAVMTPCPRVRATALGLRPSNMDHYCIDSRIHVQFAPAARRSSGITTPPLTSVSGLIQLHVSLI